MIAIHRYSPSKTGGSYHVLVLTSENTTCTSATRRSILCWAKLIKKTINELLLRLLYQPVLYALEVPVA